VGLVVGDGHCVAYVRAAANVPPTSEWIEGQPVWQCAWLPAGIAIATFDDQGRYANAIDGSSHAAILVEVDECGGLSVLDQWKLHPVARRIIRSRGGKGPAADDADRYCIIEIAGGVTA
jgi:hypothetical protein